MEKIIVVKNNDFRTVDTYLKKGAKVKMITAVPQVISSYGYSSTQMMCCESKGNYTGVVYAYVVLEMYVVISYL